MASLITRRKLLIGAAAGAVLSGCDSPPARLFLRGMTSWNQRFQQLLYSPSRLAPEEPASALTPANQFPAYFVSQGMPQPPPNWTLKVGGLVARPAVFSLDDLKRLPSTEMRVRHHCVEGWSAVASWRGVQVKEFARAVGARDDAKFVEFRSFDSGYWSSWDRDSAFHPQSILAYAFNGEDMRPDHGAPLRLYSPVKLGYKNVKYLTEVNFLPNRTGGYWEDQGYEWYAGV